MTIQFTNQLTTLSELPVGKVVGKIIREAFPGIVALTVKRLRQKKPTITSGIVYRVLYGYSTSAWIRRELLKSARKIARRKAADGRAA